MTVLGLPADTEVLVDGAPATTTTTAPGRLSVTVTAAGAAGCTVSVGLDPQPTTQERGRGCSRS